MALHIAAHLIKGLNQMAGVAMLKARILSHVGALQTYLAAHIGATAAGVGVGVLASAAAAAWWKQLNGGTEDEMLEAASQRVGQDTAKGIVDWLRQNT